MLRATEPTPSLALKPTLTRTSDLRKDAKNEEKKKKKKKKKDAVAAALPGGGFGIDDFSLPHTHTHTHTHTAV